MIRPVTGPSASSSRSAETYFNARATVRSASASFGVVGATSGEAPFEVGATDAIGADALGAAVATLPGEPAHPNAKPAMKIAAQRSCQFIIERRRATPQAPHGDRIDRRLHCLQPASWHPLQRRW